MTSIQKSRTFHYDATIGDCCGFSVERGETTKVCTFSAWQTSAHPSAERTLTYPELVSLWELLAVVIAEWPQPKQPLEWVNMETGERGVIKP